LYPKHSLGSTLQLPSNASSLKTMVEGAKLRLLKTVAVHSHSSDEKHLFPYQDLLDSVAEQDDTQKCSSEP